MKPGLRSRLLALFIGLFLLGGLILLTAFNAGKPRLLVVHSLSKESSWTEAVDRGIRGALAANRLPVSVTIDYMNLDLLSAEADRDALAASLRARIDAIDPDVLVVVDDESSQMIGRHYAAARRPAVIYTALMGEPADYGYEKGQQVFGFRERLPLAAMGLVLDEVRQGRPLRLAVLGSDNLTGRAEMRQVLSHDWGRHSLVASALAPDFDAWQAFIKGPARQADVVVVLTMDNLPRASGDGRATPEVQIVAWTEAHATALPIGVRPSYVRHGGTLAVSAPGVEYGARAIALALRLLEQPDHAPDPESLQLDGFDISVRASRLSQRDARLPKVYLEAARGAGNLYP